MSPGHYVIPCHPRSSCSIVSSLVQIGNRPSFAQRTSVTGVPTIGRPGRSKSSIEDRKSVHTLNFQLSTRVFSHGKHTTRSRKTHARHTEKTHETHCKITETHGKHTPFFIPPSTLNSARHDRHVAKLLCRHSARRRCSRQSFPITGKRSAGAKDPDTLKLCGLLPASELSCFSRRA